MAREVLMIRKGGRKPWRYLKEEVHQTKRAARTKTLRQGMIGIFQDHKQGPEEWIEELRSEGLRKDGRESRTVVKKLVGSTSSLVFTLSVISLEDFEQEII